MIWQMHTDIVLDIIGALMAHFVADFMVQTDWQARNKSKDTDALLAHICTYSAFMFGFALLVFGWRGAAIFIAINSPLHFGIDYGTSRWASARFAADDRRDGFMVIGFDQFLHQAVLIFSIWVIYVG